MRWRQRGSESGKETTAQLGGRRAARRAERRRLRGYESRRGGSAVTQFLKRRELLLREQEAVRWRQRGSESGKETTAQLGGRRAARRAERRRLRGYESRRGGSAVTQFLKRRELLLRSRSGCPYFKYSARGARITSS